MILSGAFRMCSCLFYVLNIVLAPRNFKFLKIQSLFFNEAPSTTTPPFFTLNSPSSPPSSRECTFRPARLGVPETTYFHSLSPMPTNTFSGTNARLTSFLQSASPIYHHCSTASLCRTTTPRVSRWQIQSSDPQRWHQRDRPLGTVFGATQFTSSW